MKRYFIINHHNIIACLHKLNLKTKNKNHRKMMKMLKTKIINFILIHFNYIKYL